MYNNRIELSIRMLLLLLASVVVAAVVVGGTQAMQMVFIAQEAQKTKATTNEQTNKVPISPACSFLVPILVSDA